MKYDQAVKDFEVETEIKRLRSERVKYQDYPHIYEYLYAQK